MKGGRKIFCIGLSKTGTTSLAQALRILGYSCSHYPRDPRTQQQLLHADFRLDLLDRVDAVLDSPVVPFFRDFDRLYPASKFILTLRDLESWLQSIQRQWDAYPIQGPQDHRIPARMALYGTVGFNPDRYADVWRSHHAAVRDYFQHRPNNLLELDIMAGQGWPELCRFLNEPVPDLPFPHANAGVGQPSPSQNSRGPVQLQSPSREPDPPRVMFCSWHAYLDPSSGAALSTRDLFEDLTAHGWNCRVVCGPRNDFEDGREPHHILNHHQLGYHRERCAPIGGPAYELNHYLLHGVPVTQFCPLENPSRHGLTESEVREFLGVLRRAWSEYQPDVVLTYGGSPIGPALIRMARQADIPVVFSLHNFAYRDAPWLRDANARRVPTPFAARWYRDRVGLPTEAVPWPWGPSRSMVDSIEPKYVTMVNPQPVKGSAVFARIVREMAQRRPEISFLVVEGRGGVNRLDRVMPDLTGLRNLHGMRATPRPADFYALSRAVLMPSVWEETFGRVAVESMANGIPILASRRGALPETLADAGFLFELPARCLENHREPPTAAEVEEWLITLERLHDEPEFDAAARDRCRQRARDWHPDRLRPNVERFFRQVASGQVPSQPDC